MLPLRIDVLKLDKSSFTIDNTHHDFHVCREYVKRNENVIRTQVFEYDISNSGNEDINEALMPGDIVIQGRRGMHYPLWTLANDYLDLCSYVRCHVQTDFNNQNLRYRTLNVIKMRDTIRKRLNTVLGGRRVHHVKHLKIGIPAGILRLPEGLKLKIKELSVEGDGIEVLNAILPILDATSFPLQSLSFKVRNPADSIFENEVLRASESLSIEQWGNIQLGANLLITLPNSKIHLKRQIPLNEIVLLARNWMKHHRAIGTRFSMETESVKENLDGLKKKLNAVEGIIDSERRCSQFPFCYTLLMASTSELNVYGYESPNHEEEVSRGHRSQYMVVMEVMPIRSARPIIKLTPMR